MNFFDHVFEDVINDKSIRNLSTATLQQYRATAKTTGCLALGHMKSERNHDAENRYARELTRRGAVIDTSIKGGFNGKGSW